MAANIVLLFFSWLSALVLALQGCTVGLVSLVTSLKIVRGRNWMPKIDLLTTGGLLSLEKK